MIDLYKQSNTDFEHNGDMPLIPSSATVHTVLNGTWNATIVHPIDAEGRWKYIQEEAVIRLPSFNGDQLFRVKKKTKTDSGVTATSEPIFMDAMNDCFLVDVRPTIKNGQEALDMMMAANEKYSGESNIVTTATAYYQFKNLIEAINGDDANAFTKRWGGEILYDNFHIHVDDHIGSDHGVELRYGKNIPQNGMSEDVDISSVITRIYPKAYNGYMMTNNGYVDSPLVNNYPLVKTATITFSDVKMRADAQEDDEENGVIICDNQAELDAALTQRCNEQYTAGLDKPKVTISADMILLADTEQYKDYQVLETVSLGDTVHCINNHLGIVTDARVIELEYDSLQKKVSSVVLGDFQYNYFNNVSSSMNRIDGVVRPDGSLIAEKIAGFIDGAMASLRAQYNVAQKQDVMAILFENLDEDSPLYGAMALGTQGLQISKTRDPDGRSWDWTTALTANGLIANIIVAGILSDKLGRNYWNLDTGEFSLSAQGFTVDGEPAEDYFKDNFSQQEIFDKLTNNGAAQGIYLQNGQLYVNAQYMVTGILSDKLGRNSWNMDTGVFQIMARNSDNEVTFSIDQYGRLTINTSNFSVQTDGSVTLKNATIENGTISVTGANGREYRINRYGFQMFHNGTLIADISANGNTPDIIDGVVISGHDRIYLDGDIYTCTSSDSDLEPVVKSATVSYVSSGGLERVLVIKNGLIMNY